MSMLRYSWGMDDGEHFDLVTSLEMAGALRLAQQVLRRLQEVGGVERRLVCYYGAVPEEDAGSERAWTVKVGNRGIEVERVQINGPQRLTFSRQVLCL